MIQKSTVRHVDRKWRLAGTLGMGGRGFRGGGSRLWMRSEPLVATLAPGGNGRSFSPRSCQQTPANAGYSQSAALVPPLRRSNLAEIEYTQYWRKNLRLKKKTERETRKHWIRRGSTVRTCEPPGAMVKGTATSGAIHRSHDRSTFTSLTWCDADTAFQTD